MTRGQIHTSGQVAKDGVIEVQLGFNVSPSFKVLVYYVNSLGETIADSKTYNVANCFQNKVRVWGSSGVHHIPMPQTRPDLSQKTRYMHSRFFVTF